MGCARPNGARLPTSVILRGFHLRSLSYGGQVAACLAVPKASKGINAYYCTFAVEYQSLREYYQFAVENSFELLFFGCELLGDLVAQFHVVDDFLGVIVVFEDV